MGKGGVLRATESLGHCLSLGRHTLPLLKETWSLEELRCLLQAQHGGPSSRLRKVQLTLPNLASDSETLVQNISELSESFD